MKISIVYPNWDREVPILQLGPLYDPFFQNLVI